MNVDIIGELRDMRDRARDIRDSAQALIDYLTDEVVKGKVPPDEGVVIDLREGGGCQCTGDPLPNVQNTAGAGMSGSTYSCVGCGQEVTDVSKRKVVGG